MRAKKVLITPMRTTDIATDRWRGPMSEMLLYTEHPYLPIHAALFSNFDGTCSVVVSGRDGRDLSAEYTVNLSGANAAGVSAMEIVLRPATRPSDQLTFEDTGNQYTGIRFDLEKPALDARHGLVTN